MKKLELLAPSGDWDSFTTAIQNGADAVYLGLGEFNARAKSTYFSTQNIRETVRYAHLRGVKVYVTINTLVSDTEMPDFLHLVEACIAAKVDAYIVQDYGCANLLKTMYPNIVLHASTQMGIHNAKGAEIAKKMGFSRVVLSREAKLVDILAIHATGIEIEYFVQGALCVAFSGNCYFSALRHNMSGNRGKCLQLCRLPYTAQIGDTPVGSGYLLSARDLCMLPRLAELIDAGVISFKIEGRLRRAGYVGQAVSTYRTAIDNLLAGKKTDDAAEILKLRQVFSRGDFNYSAYLEPNVPDNVINPRNQNHLGLKIGSVVSVERFKDLYKVGIRTQHRLEKGDGLKFLDENQTEFDSLGVGNVEYKSGVYYIYTKHRLATDLTVYLTLDSALENVVIKTSRLLPIKLSFIAREGCPFEIKISAEHPTPVQVDWQSEYICQTAKTAPTSEAEIREIFGSLEPDTFSTAVITDIGNVFIPKSALKEARRALVEILTEQIIANFEQNLPQISRVCDLESIEKPTYSSKFDNIIVVNEKSDLTQISIGENDLILLSPSDFAQNFVLDGLNKLRTQSDNIGLALPTIANAQDCAKLDNLIDSLPADTPLLVSNAYGLKYADRHYIIAGTDMNVYSDFSARALQNLGVSEFVWSKEVPATSPQVYQFAYGHQTLMHFAHCPYKTVFGNTCARCSFRENLTLTDQAGKRYLVLRHKITQCYFTLLDEFLTDKRELKKKFIDLRS